MTTARVPTALTALAIGQDQTSERTYRLLRSAVLHCDGAEFRTALVQLTQRLVAAGFQPCGIRAGAFFHTTEARSSSTSRPRRRVVLASATEEPGSATSGVHEPSTTLFGELARHELWVLVEAESAPADDAEIVRVVTALLDPFTDAERGEVARLNPLVGRVVDAHRGSGKALSETTLLLREHLLLEKLNLLLGLLELGLEPRRTLVVPKPDATLYRRRVIAELRRHGVTVAQSVTAAMGVARRWGVGTAAGGPTVVVDDGGDLAMSLLSSSHPADRLAVIETTTKGIRLLHRAGLLERVLNLSDTSIKRDMAGATAASCVCRFREMMRHQPMNAASCVVVGFGQLGTHVATQLRQLGLSVRVVDVDPAARERAAAAGFPHYQETIDAADPSVRYLFGCSGAQAVGLGEVLRLGRDAVLCALSSQDLLPAVTALRRVAVASTVRGVGTRYRMDGRTVTVLADGHAINLHHAEGINEPDYDTFTALTCLAIAESAQSLATTPHVRPMPEGLCAKVRDLQRADACGTVMGRQ